MDVVTGAAGFIGSHLTERLLASGRTVTGIDSFDHYYARAVKEANLASVRGRAGFTFVEGDLLEVDLPRVLEGADRVFHLASRPGVRGGWGPEFDQYVRNNVFATHRVLEACAQSRVRRVVYGSSSSIYGNQPEGPTSESALPRPISPYAVTKLTAEHLVYLFHQERSLDTVALRFFTVYGPRQRPDMAFHKFIRAIRSGSPITLYGGGNWRRDFTFIDDIVDGIVAAAERAEPGATLNLGRGAPCTLWEAVRALEGIVGHPIEVHLGEAPGGEPSSTWADTRRAAEQLGYQPRVSLPEGLRRQWEWFMDEGRRGSTSGAIPTA